jgi:hypothetical protein
VAKSFGEVVRPISGDVGALAETGKLAALLCRLARERFTGVVYAEHEETGAVFSFRDGRAVFVEDLGDAQTIPDMLLERGLLSNEQYTQIATRVVESLAEDEDMAFCEQAVELRILAPSQIDAELDRRVRGRIIQAIGWEVCRIELDADPDSLTGIREFPQSLGPLVYVGVRTFYDEERVRAAIGLAGDLYIGLTRPVQEAAEFFELEVEDIELLAGLRPDATIVQLIDESSVDPLEAWQLFCALTLAGMTEISNAPLYQAEPSGVRSTLAPASTNSAAPDRERRSSSQSHVPVAREERATPTREPTPSKRVGPAHSTSYSSATMHAIREEQISSPRAPSGQRLPVAPTNIAARQPVEPAPVPTPRERPKPRKLGAALKRLDQELKHLKQQPLSHPSAATSSPPETKAHVEQLRRMRQGAAAAQPQKPQANATRAADLFRSAQDALREQQFGRAHEIMRRTCEAEPNNELYSIYCMWASFRANTLHEDGVGKLRQALREKISDDQLKPFAYYALGHIALFDKKDEAAEKCFRKAVELDKHNKDAERHLRIIELRRKTAADHDKGNKIFGIEIKPRNKS